MKMLIAMTTLVMALTLAATAGEQTETTDKAGLESRYLELAAKHAKLLTAEQLTEVIEELERQHQEAIARQQLEEAQGMLEALTKEHPKTSAAQMADKMLRAIATERAVETFPGSRVFSPISEPESY